MLSWRKQIDIHDEQSVLRYIRRVHLRNLFFLVLLLSLAAWWKRGFWVALVSGAALYGFFVLLFVLADRVDIVMLKWRARRRDGTRD